MTKQPFTRSVHMRNIEWCMQWCMPLPRNDISDMLYARCNRLWVQPSVNLNNALQRALMKTVARQPWL